jgi:hypothetical protein
MKTRHHSQLWFPAQARRPDARSFSSDTSGRDGDGES